MDFKELTEKQMQLHKELTKAINEKLMNFQMENGVTVLIDSMSYDVGKYPTSKDEPLMFKIKAVMTAIGHPVSFDDVDNVANIVTQKTELKRVYCA